MRSGWPNVSEFVVIIYDAMGGNAMFVDLREI